VAQENLQKILCFLLNKSLENHLREMKTPFGVPL